MSSECIRATAATLSFHSSSPSPFFARSALIIAKICCSIAAAEGLFGLCSKRFRVAPSSRGRPASGRRSKFMLARVCAAESLQKKLRVNRIRAKDDFIGPHFGGRTILTRSGFSALRPQPTAAVAFSDKVLLQEDQGETAPIK